jgi:hypothetical protein
MQSNCNRSVPSLLNESCTTLQRVPRRRRVNALTGYLSTASFFADLYHGGFFSPGQGLDRRILALRQNQLGKMPHAQPGSRLETAQQVHWSRLKIVTNVVGVICSSKPRQPLVVLSQRKQRRCVLMGRSGYQDRLAWDLVQLRV